MYTFLLWNFYLTYSSFYILWTRSLYTNNNSSNRQILYTIDLLLTRYKIKQILYISIYSIFHTINNNMIQLSYIV